MVLSLSPIQIGTAVTLNAVDSNGTIWRVNQDGVTGLGSPSTTLNPVPKTRQRGATAGDSFDQGRIVTIGGTVTALTPDLLNAAINLLKASVTRAAFKLTFTETNQVQYIMARRQGETLIAKVTNVHALYSIQVFAQDPRLFTTPLVASTREQASSGGYTYPMTYPMTITSTVISGLITLTNPGAETGPVLARVDGPCHGPIITHQGIGASTIFSLTTLNLVSGEYLLIDMEAKTVLGNGTASRSLYVTSRAWSGFDPGLNIWSFNAVSPDPTALLTITATPAS